MAEQVQAAVRIQAYIRRSKVQRVAQFKREWKAAVTVQSKYRIKVAKKVRTISSHKFYPATRRALFAQ